MRKEDELTVRRKGKAPLEERCPSASRSEFRQGPRKAGGRALGLVPRALGSLTLCEEERESGRKRKIKGRPWGIRSEESPWVQSPAPKKSRGKSHKRRGRSRRKKREKRRRKTYFARLYKELCEECVDMGTVEV